MDRLARSTGGRAIVTEKIDDLRGAFAELLDEQAAAVVGEVAMDDQRERIDGLARDEHVDADEIAGPEAR